MVMPAASPLSTPAYQSGALLLFAIAGGILTALGFEHIGGYIPCPLCLMQRWAYYAGVPVTFVALVMLSSGKGRLAALLFFLVSLAFLANAGLGVYHAGAEWKYWPGPETCAGSQAITGSAGSLLKDLSATRVIRCDEAPWRMLGLSFAGWNAVLSLGLSMLALVTAFRAVDTK